MTEPTKAEEVKRLLAEYKAADKDVSEAQTKRVMAWLELIHAVTPEQAAELLKET